MQGWPCLRPALFVTHTVSLRRHITLVVRRNIPSSTSHLFNLCKLIVSVTGQHAPRDGLNLPARMPCPQSENSSHCSFIRPTTQLRLEHSLLKTPASCFVQARDHCGFQIAGVPINDKITLCPSHRSISSAAGCAGTDQCLPAER